MHSWKLNENILEMASVWFTKPRYEERKIIYLHVSDVPVEPPCLHLVLYLLQQLSTFKICLLTSSFYYLQESSLTETKRPRQFMEQMLSHRPLRTNNLASLWSTERCRSTHWYLLEPGQQKTFWYLITTRFHNDPSDVVFKIFVTKICNEGRIVYRLTMNPLNESI